MSSDPCIDELEDGAGDGTGDDGTGGAGGAGDGDGGGIPDPDEETSEAPFVQGLADGTNNIATGDGASPGTGLNADGGLELPPQLQGIDLNRYGIDDNTPLTEEIIANLLELLNEEAILARINNGEMGINEFLQPYNFSLSLLRRMNPGVSVAEARQDLLNNKSKRTIAGTDLALQSEAAFVEILEGRDTAWQRSTWLFNDSLLMGATRTAEDIVTHKINRTIHTRDDTPAEGNYFKTPNTWYNFHSPLRYGQPNSVPPHVAKMYEVFRRQAVSVAKGTIREVLSESGNLTTREHKIVDPVRLLSNKMWINTSHLDGPSFFKGAGPQKYRGSVDFRTNRRHEETGAAHLMRERFHKRGSSLYFINNEVPSVSDSGLLDETFATFMKVNRKGDQSDRWGQIASEDLGEPNYRIAYISLLTDNWAPTANRYVATQFDSTSGELYVGPYAARNSEDLARLVENNIDAGGLFFNRFNLFNKAGIIAQTEKEDIFHPVFWRNIRNCHEQFNVMNKLATSIKHELYALNTEQMGSGVRRWNNDTDEDWTWASYLYGHVQPKQYMVLDNPDQYPGAGFVNMNQPTARGGMAAGMMDATPAMSDGVFEFSSRPPAASARSLRNRVRENYANGVYNRENLIDNLYADYGLRRALNMNMYPVFPFWGAAFAMQDSCRPYPVDSDGPTKTYDAGSRTGHPYQIPPPTVGKFIFEDYCTNVPDALLAEETKTNRFAGNHVGNPATVSIKPVYNYYDCLYENYFAHPAHGIPEVELPSPYLFDYKTLIDNMTKEGNSMIDNQAYRRLLLLRFAMMGSIKDRQGLGLTGGSESIAIGSLESTRLENLREQLGYGANVTDAAAQAAMYNSVVGVIGDMQDPLKVRDMAYQMSNVYGFDMAPPGASSKTEYISMFDNEAYRVEVSDAGDGYPNYTRDFFLSSLPKEKLEEAYERRNLNQMFVEFEIDSLGKSQIADALTFNGDDSIIQRLFTTLNPVSQMGYFNQGQSISDSILNPSSIYNQAGTVEEQQDSVLASGGPGREQSFARSFRRSGGTTFSYVKQMAISEMYNHVYEQSSHRVNKNILLGNTTSTLKDYSDNYPIYPVDESGNDKYVNMIDFSHWFGLVMGELSSVYYSSPLKKFESIFKLLKIKANVSRILNDKVRSWKQMIQGVPAANEVLGYMISKSKVKSDGSTVHISNFWIMGRNDKDVQKFVDTQIKYGEVYEYQVHQIVAIIGNNYSYLDPLGHNGGETRNAIYDYDPEEMFDHYLLERVRPQNKQHSVFPFGVVNMPCLKIATLPSHTKRVAVADRPPIYPNVDIIPFKNESTKILFNLSSNTGKTRTAPVFLQADDVAQFYISLLNQGVEDTLFKTYDQVLPSAYTDGIKLTWAEYFKDNPLEIKRALLEFKSDDPATTFEIFRVDFHPTKYEDFRNNMIRRIEGTADNAGFVDNILPNKKYYYVFRTEDVHGHVSNPSHIYEVELATINEAVRPIIKVVEPTGGREEVGRLGESSFKLRQFFSLRPALLQKRLRVPDEGIFKGSNLEREGRLERALATPRGFDNSVFGKKFKMRIKSKRTGKEIDINIKFNLKKRDKREEDTEENPQTLC